jgi:hypothetical protein
MTANPKKTSASDVLTTGGPISFCAAGRKVFVAVLIFDVNFSDDVSRRRSGGVHHLYCRSTECKTPYDHKWQTFATRRLG